MGEFDLGKVFAWMMVWASGACIAVIAAAAVGDGQLGAAVLNDPIHWLAWPAGIGAFGGFGYGVIRA